MSDLKRFLVFAGEKYYPLGGFDDFKASFETKEEALNFSPPEYSRDWLQIIDSKTGGKINE